MAIEKSVNNNSTNSYAEDWITVKNIIDGMIQLENGYYVTGIKVMPKNIFIMDEGEKNNTLFSLQNFYNMIDYEFWLVVADRPVDINLYISQLELHLNNVQDPALRKLVVDDIAKADMFVNNDVVDTEYFILFKDNNTDSLNKKVRNLINNFASCGLIASQTSNDDLRMILDNFLNGGVTYKNRTVAS
jgi:hypothetical protein